MTTTHIPTDCSHILEHLEGVASEGAEIEYVVPITPEQREQIVRELGEPFHDCLVFTHVMFRFVANSTTQNTN